MVVVGTVNADELNIIAAVTAFGSVFVLGTMALSRAVGALGKLFGRGRDLRPSLVCEPNSARLGQTIHVRLTLRPRSRVRLEYVEFKLICERTEEIAAPLFDTRSSAERYDDLRTEVVWSGLNYPISGPVDLPPGEHNFEAEMLVSGEGRPTKSDGKLQIDWWLEATPKRRGSGNQVERCSLTVKR